jgi:ABC-type sugar transport system substrate-binding protein
VLAGEMSETVDLAPIKMGSLGFENFLKLNKGVTLPENIDTVTVLVTKENAEQYK